MSKQNYKLEIVLSGQEIDQSINRISAKISEDYKNAKPILIGVLKGAFIFLADLSRSLDMPVEIDFIGASSYGDKAQSSGKPKVTKEIGINVSGQDVIVVEDIIDTGLTTSMIMRHIETLGPKSLKLCALIDKRERRQTDIKIDYAGNIIQEGFLVGYGLDFNEKYRNLPGIYKLEP